MRKYNISANLVRTTEQLYERQGYKCSLDEWFRTTVWVRLGCLLSPALMSDALDEHDGKVSTCGKNTTNLCFVDDTVALAEAGTRSTS